jgi:membrane protease YdiL (CAAX protease family)
VLAVLLGALPLYSGGILYQLRRDQPFSIQVFVFYLAVIAPLAILITLLVLRFLCGERLRDLNLKPGKMSWDLRATLILSLVIIAANVLSTETLSGVLPESSTRSGVRDLFEFLTADPRLLLLFVGPLIFLGAASEELIRAFLLSRLWRVWRSPAGKLVVVVISACLFGLLHLYQGPVGAGRAVILGLIMAFYYLLFGRVVPLVVAHYLTNALQVVVFALRGQ